MFHSYVKLPEGNTSYKMLQVLQMLPEHLQCEVSEVTFQAKVAHFVNPQAGPWRIAWHLYRDPSASSTLTWPDLREGKWGSQIHNPNSIRKPNNCCMRLPQKHYRSLQSLHPKMWPETQDSKCPQG